MNVIISAESTMDTSASGLVASPTPVTTVSFTLNGDPVTVEGATPQLTLNEWIRTQPGLSGTKKMCGEGGCGCCVVAVTRVDPVVQQEATIAINSCLCPLYSVEGWNITTVEGIGSSRTKFHPIQQRIVQYNGSQCGYCTPGFVMNMYSLLRENPKPTMQLVEDYFDGNICRCTGYRSILDAMKSFAVDSNSSKAGCIDIEDLGSPKLSCPLSRKPCTEGDVCRGHRRVQSDPEWYQPSSLSGLAEIIASHRDSKLKLVAGSTGRGIFKAPEEVDIYVDVKGIGDLHKVEVTDSSLTVGGAMTLSNLIGVLMTNRDKSSTFEHLASHLLKVANVPVRNVGTWAGNLMLTHNNDNFPSDVFTIMTAVGATITIGSLASVTWDYTTLSLWDFLSRDMKNSIIVSMEIPFASSDVVFRSFKILPTAQNSYAYLNAAFSVEVDSNTFTVKGKPSLVYGGIDTHAISASKTETYLEGKELRDPNTLKGALESLVKEISPNSPPAAASPEYRKSLATSLFFKFYLSAIGGLVSPEVKSASFPFIRPISKGSQSFSTNPSEYPVTEPRTKLTAILQATGEAEYTTDIPTHPAEAAAAFVLTTQGNAKITGMDFSKAEQMPGCLKIITAADIPDGGENNFLPSPFYSEQELVMATNFSEYAGQPVAIVIADTQWNATRIAEAAAAGVKYEIVGKPILTIQEAITAGSFFDPPGASVLQVGDAKSAIADSSRVIKGEVAMGSQHHFNMETQIAFCIPEEDGYTVYSSSAWPSFTQAAVANILGIPASSVNVSVKRCGGSYGSKISRCNWIAAGTALAAYVTERPVRMHMDIDTTMKMVGKRFPYYATYTIGCTNEGIINGIEATVYDDAGFINTDSSLQLALYHLDNAYHVPNWLVTPKACKTNTPSNTYVRSPGTIPGVFISEAMVNHVAKALSLNVEDVKRKNLYQKGQVTPSGMELKYCNISTLWDQLYQSSDMANRKKRVEEFNQANRWRKRGITMVPLRFGCEWNAAPYSAHVGIYRKDGTVAIAHGGIEVGQGINTKVAQVAAKTLGIPIELIRIKPTNTLISPNDFTTGGSTTSELCCKGVINACNSLNSRIEPVRQKYPDVGWKELIGKCYDDGLDLVARHYVFEKTDHFVYNSYGVTCTEVEVDILTGETQILRVDILEDCGESINPEIDVGQVEGAFVMGLGNWLTEKIMYDGDTGQQLTHNTWEYNPPCSKDIPIDFRVELLKNAPNPLGVLGSKAVGEPPQCMSCSILFAVKRAIESARSEIGKGGYFPMDGPATVEAIQQACLVDPSHFTF